MNKTELISQVQKNLKGDASLATAQRAVDAVLGAITTGIKDSAKKVKATNRYENAVQLIGFGTFKVVWRSARDGRNPSTGNKIKIKASKAVNFSPSAPLKRTVK